MWGDKKKKKSHIHIIDVHKVKEKYSGTEKHLKK